MTRWRVAGGVLCAAVLLCTTSRAMGDDAAPDRPNDTGRLYFNVVAGANFILDTPFAPGVDITKNPDDLLGGGVGYNISRHWGVELQAQGSEPNIDSDAAGKIRELSIISVVPVARYRWHLMDDRLVPFVTGGVGMAFTDVNEDAKPRVKATADSSTILGSVSAGLDWFLADDVALGVEGRYLIFPDQDTTVSYQDPKTLRIRTTPGSMNLTSISLLARLTVFLGQQEGSEGGRTVLLSTHGPYDDGTRRVYLSGLFGYDALFSLDGGAGTKLRSKGGDFNLTKGGALGLNLDEHWGGEIQVLVTPLTVRTPTIDKISEVNDTAVLPTVRFRWPLLGGRLVPFATAGAGVGVLVVNDPRVAVDVSGGTRTVKSPKWYPDTPLFVGSIGVGLEYFLNRHFSVGAYVPVHFYPDTDVKLVQPNGTTTHGTANFSGVIPMLQLKAYLP